MWLFAAFLIIPLIEIGLFIQIGGWLGLWSTLAIVVLTALIGTHFVRSQGLIAIEKVRNSFSRLNDPSEPLAHGAMILFAGALLLTPGFFTDAVGFALLAPPIRAAILSYLRTRISVRHVNMRAQSDPYRDSDRATTHEDAVIDGDYHELPKSNSAKGGRSGWTKH